MLREFSQRLLCLFCICIHLKFSKGHGQSEFVELSEKKANTLITFIELKHQWKTKLPDYLRGFDSGSLSRTGSLYFSVCVCMHAAHTCAF